jgi:hypothetical protein
MNEYLPAELSQAYLLLLLLAAVLLLTWFLYRRHRRQKRTLAGVIKVIAFEQLNDLVIPSADDGEIHIDHLLLTAEGLLIIDVKAVSGSVFGSD